MWVKAPVPYDPLFPRPESAGYDVETSLILYTLYTGLKLTPRLQAGGSKLIM